MYYDDTATNRSYIKSRTSKASIPLSAGRFERKLADTVPVVVSLMTDAAEHESSLAPALPEGASGAIDSESSIAWTFYATEEAVNEVQVTAPTSETV